MADPTEHTELVSRGSQDVEAALAHHRHLLVHRQLEARRVLPRVAPY